MSGILKVAALLLVICLFVLNSACKKDKDTINGPQRLKTYTEDITAVGGRTVETFNVNYDEQGRLTSIVSTTKVGHRLVYDYLSNDKFTYEQIEDNKVILHCDYFINGEVNMVDSVYTYNIRKDTISFKYIYDADNRLIKKKEYMNSYLLPPFTYNTFEYQYDLKGTLTKIAESFAETTYRYDEQYKNTVQLEPSYFYFRQQLPTHTYATRHNVTITTEHTYTLDGQKRVISERASSNDGRIVIKSYTYQ